MTVLQRCLCLHLSHRERSDHIVRCDPGEGMRTVDRPYPLTPALSPQSRIYPTSTYWKAQLGYIRVGWERGRTVFASNVFFLNERGIRG